MRRSALALAVALVAASEAQAQQQARSRLESFRRLPISTVPSDLNQAKGGPGARIGYFLSDRLAIEAEGSWVPTNGPNDVDVKYMPLHARVVLNFPGERARRLPPRRRLHPHAVPRRTPTSRTTA